MTDNTSDTEVIERMKREILADIEAGTVPATVRSYSELHDHVDANGYGGAFEHDELIDTPAWEEFIDQINRCQTVVDTWLRTGRGETVTDVEGNVWVWHPVVTDAGQWIAHVPEIEDYANFVPAGTSLSDAVRKFFEEN